MLAVDRFKNSAQVFGYVAKPLKKRLVALRQIDSKRYGESRVIEEALERVLPEIEAEAYGLQQIPTREARRRGRKIAV